MWNIRTEVLSATSKLRIEVIELSKEEIERVRSTVLHKFASDLKRWPLWIWEYAQPAAYVVSPKGWRWISSFSPTKEVIMFFALEDEATMYRIPNGKCAEEILSACLNFEVYFTDPDINYLFGHNHHDCVFACGTAKEWLEQHKLELLTT